ncbi:MAG: hypothetical protein HFH60_00400 [Lachnospiraceae bacterium]|nr:hypothetical protein [Lachnospiraceae bacterium]
MGKYYQKSYWTHFPKYGMIYAVKGDVCESRHSDCRQSDFSIGFQTGTPSEAAACVHADF